MARLCPDHILSLDRALRPAHARLIFDHLALSAATATVRAAIAVPEPVHRVILVSAAGGGDRLTALARPVLDATALRALPVDRLDVMSLDDADSLGINPRAVYIVLARADPAGATVADDFRVLLHRVHLRTRRPPLLLIADDPAAGAVPAARLSPLIAGALGHFGMARFAPLALSFASGLSPAQAAWLAAAALCCLQPAPAAHAADASAPAPMVSIETPQA